MNLFPDFSLTMECDIVSYDIGSYKYIYNAYRGVSARRVADKMINALYFQNDHVMPEWRIGNCSD